MDRRPRTTPRKQATQDRSRATVDAIVEATARILVREGYDKASTNRIAEAAGVSIGSLYQYFPGKDALVAAVIDRHAHSIMRVVRAAFEEAAALPLAEGVRCLVTVAIEAHRIDPQLHRVLAEQIPRTGRLSDVETFNREAYQLLKAWIERRAEEVTATDPGVAAYLCINAIEAVAHNAVLYHEEGLTPAVQKVLVDEATRMIAGYLSS